jgi:hypothetical protein
MVRWVRASKLVSVNHLSGHIIFGPLFLSQEERAWSGPLCFIIRVRASIRTKSVHHLSMYIQYCRSTRFCHRLFTGRCSERCSVESSTLAIGVVVFFVQVRASELRYCSLCIISVWYQHTILDPWFLFWEYISRVIRGQVSRRPLIPSYSLCHHLLTSGRIGKVK